MSSIKNLPLSERPYEKLEMYGEKTLTDSELLAIILKTGNKGNTAVSLAQNILSINKEGTIGLLQNVSLNELKRINGVGRVKAIQIKAVCELAKRMSKPLNLNIKIEKPIDVANLLMEELRYEKKEIVKILILNTKNIIQKILDIAIGTSSSAKIEVKQIFEEIIKTGENKFILVHNHPSGNSTPSTKDLELTKKIEKAAILLDIQFLDHIVIGNGNYQSIMTILYKKQKI